MSILAHHELESRRFFNWEVARRMNQPDRYLFTAHKTAGDAERGANPINNASDARHAIHYRAEFHVRTLVGPNRYSDLTLIRVDAASAEYPFEAPSAWVVEKGKSKMPWSPHFTSGVPVCHGTVWRSDGSVLLAHYFIHLAHLLNWDEDMDREYGGYKPDAVRWWRENLNRLLTPDLVYPQLPVDLLYGERATPAAGGFKPRVGNVCSSAPSGGFRPLR